MGGLFESPQVNIQNPPERIPGLTGLGQELIKLYMQNLGGQRQAIPYRGYLSMLDPRITGPRGQYWNPYGPSILEPPPSPSPDRPGGGNIPPSRPPIDRKQAQADKRSDIGLSDIERPVDRETLRGDVTQGSLFGPNSSVVNFIEKLFPGYIERAFAEKSPNTEYLTGNAPEAPKWSEEREGSFPEKTDIIPTRENVSPERQAQYERSGYESPQTSDDIIDDILDQIDSPRRGDAPFAI